MWIIDYLSKDALGRWRDRENVDPLVATFRSTREEEQIQNICLNLLFGLLLFEPYYNPYDRVFMHKYGLMLVIVNIGFKFGYNAYAKMGWINAQKKGQPYYFIPCLLKIVYYIFFYTIGVVSALLADSTTECDGDSAASCQLAKDWCYFMLQFPYNSLELESDKVVTPRETPTELAVIRSLGISYQLAQLFLLIKCWRFISSCRGRALLALESRRAG